MFIHILAFPLAAKALIQRENRFVTLIHPYIKIAKVKDIENKIIMYKGRFHIDYRTTYRTETPYLGMTIFNVINTNSS